MTAQDETEQINSEVQAMLTHLRLAYDDIYNEQTGAKVFGHLMRIAETGVAPDEYLSQMIEWSREIMCQRVQAERRYAELEQMSERITELHRAVRDGGYFDRY